MGARTAKTAVEDPLLPPDVPISEDALTEAVWSVAFYSFYLDPGIIPTEFAQLRPIHLAEGIDILLSPFVLFSPFVGAESIIPWVIWSHSRLLKAGYYSEASLHPPDLMRALHELDVFVARVTALSADSPTPCDIAEIENEATYRKGDVRAVAKVSVGRRSLGDLVVPMDPRKWQTTIGGPFRETFEIEKTADGYPSQRRDGSYVRAGTDAPPGDEFYLREVFKIKGLRFDNVLKTTYSPAKDKITLEYGLWESIAYFGGDWIGAIMVRNEGTATAEVDQNDKSRLIVDGHKTARFSKNDPLGDVLSYTSAALLTLWQGATNNLGICYLP